MTAAYVRLRFIAGVRERWEWAIHVAPGRYVDTDGTPIRRKERLLGQPLDAWPARMNGGRLATSLYSSKETEMTTEMTTETETATTETETATETATAILYDYKTGEPIRPATATEIAASLEAATSDGGAGVITVDGLSYYVVTLDVRAMTLAERASALFDDDGLCWTAEDGRDLNEVCHDLGAVTVIDDLRGARYHFADGSAIVAADEAWDLGYVGDEYEDCLCWQAAGPEHDETCAHYEEVA